MYVASCTKQCKSSIDLALTLIKGYPMEFLTIGETVKQCFDEEVVYTFLSHVHSA